MKILAAGDIHGDIELSRRLAEKGAEENVNFVVLCGDLTFAESSIDNLMKPFVEKGQKVVLIPGNHETEATVDFLCQRYDAINLHGYSFIYKDVGLFGCGSANIGLFQLNENDFFDILSRGHKYIENAKKKIMVTHCHPSGTLMEKFTSIFPGSSGIRKAVDTLKPDLLLCSHVHEADGIEEKIGNTKIINVGKKGKIIEI